MKVEAKIRELLSSVLDQHRPSGTSLIVTIFGDAIVPHGGSASLASLVQLMNVFGINERGTRTAVFRLAKEGWLISSHVGRRSYYALTESGQLRFEAAGRAIYAATEQPWDRKWSIVFTGLLEARAREKLRDDLAWQGFGLVLPGVMVHPAPDRMSLRQALQEAGVAGNAMVMRATGEDWMSDEGMREIAQRAWDLTKLATNYEVFLANFRPILRSLEACQASPELGFYARTLLIHEYRRALLPDPMLPAELLPSNWPGAAARLLCRNLYRMVQQPAERYLLDNVETADGRLPDAAAIYFERFGGLPQLW